MADELRFNSHIENSQHVTSIQYVNGDVIIYQDGKKVTVSIKDAFPYLAWLRKTSMQSGLLRVMDPRVSMPGAQDSRVTIDDVYTPLDVRSPDLRGLDIDEEIITRTNRRGDRRAAP